MEVSRTFDILTARQQVDTLSQLIDQCNADQIYQLKHKLSGFNGSSGPVCGDPNYNVAGNAAIKKQNPKSGKQAWIKKDQFVNAKRVSGGFGEAMLKKMGWEQGEGLGRHKHGEVDPITMDIKTDKKGLSAADEGKKKCLVVMKNSKDLSGKHPVTALTELCIKRKWSAPVFTPTFDCGPPHKKQYIFKVTVDGRDYKETSIVDNKKVAKANAALNCLRSLGMVPKEAT